MSKNLCPENNLLFVNSQTIRFETNIPAGTYTASAIVKSDEPTEEYNLAELCLYFAAMARVIPLAICHDPTCRLTHLLRKYIDPDYVFPVGFSTGVQSIAEVYIWDLILGTKVGLVNTPKSDMEKYLHAMIGGTVEEMPDLDGSVLNYWMNQALEAIKNGN